MVNNRSLALKSRLVFLAFIIHSRRFVLLYRSTPLVPVPVSCIFASPSLYQLLPCNAQFLGLSWSPFLPFNLVPVRRDFSINIKAIIKATEIWFVKHYICLVPTPTTPVSLLHKPTASVLFMPSCPTSHLFYFCTYYMHHYTKTPDLVNPCTKNKLHISILQPHSTPASTLLCN